MKGVDLIASAAASRKDVWIVGSRGKYERERTLVLHYDGRSLSVVPTPNPFSRANLLWGVAVFGPRDVWAVGEGVSQTRPIYRYVPLVMHYDGSRWSRVSVPTIESGFGASLNTIAGAAADDIWAVGTARADPGEDWVGFVEHWDGDRWQIVPSTTASYSTVTVVSPNDVWAAGSWGDDESPIAHWDGLRWTSTPDTAHPDTETFAYASAASGASDVWMVGREAAAPFVERYNGRQFVRVPLPDAHWRAIYRSKTNSYLAGVEAISPRDVWAVGNVGIEHYNGQRWQLRSRDGSYSHINAVTPTDLWAVGGAKVLHRGCK